MHDARRQRAIRTCDVCGDCGAPIAPGDAVWMGWHRDPRSRARELHPVCQDCHRATTYFPAWQRARPCDLCKRDVTYHRHAGLSTRRVYIFCSERCRNRYAAKRRSAVLALDRHRLCSVCGEHFQPPRSDARTCSPACRQKAYRQRRATPAMTAS